jgi:hypothetical protein
MKRNKTIYNKINKNKISFLIFIIFIFISIGIIQYIIYINKIKKIKETFLLKKDRCCIISTKNPTKEILLKTIENIKLFYPEFDIIIIDSDSNKKECFDLIPDDCIIEYCKNKNWELGAWNYAYNKYNNYKVYMFIQDSLIPICRIPNLDQIKYDNGTIYTFNYSARISDGGYFDHLINIYKNTELHFISEMNPFDRINCCAHSSFIINNEDVKNILQLENAYIEKSLTKSKIDSWLSERTCGILADKQKNRIDIASYFLKYNCHRDY